jgi:hypothetical protein
MSDCGQGLTDKIRLRWIVFQNCDSHITPANVFSLVLPVDLSRARTPNRDPEQYLTVDQVFECEFRQRMG